MGLLTGHCHLKRHLFKLRPVDSPGHDGTNRHLKFETALHVLCDREALAVLRYKHLGQYVLTPGDLADICQQGTAHCPKCGAAECLSKGLHKKLQMAQV
jgi:hypothetical protein